MATGYAEKAAGRVLLPDSVVPSRYDLHFTPDLERFTFDGKASITVEVQEATNEVKLHAVELQIMSVAFVPKEGAKLDVETITISLKEKTATFIFGDFLPVGAGTLEISFVGQHNNQMAGFYRSGYKDIHGNSKVMVSTQFEAIDARRCFPCWDEPAAKAVFAVTLTVDPALGVLCNMPEKCSRLVKQGSKVLREVEFMDSPKMSTYLLAMVIGEFDFVQDMTAGGVLVRVFTPPGRSADGTFALNCATKCLDLYNEFFGLPYPLPKLDMIAIPEFAQGAMENWGLVTYREVDLLIDQKMASGQQKQRVAIVVTHELAHQWFGNLVTMRWWDDLWLNEGFASWCENYAVDKIYPEYQLWDQFCSDTLAAALRLDGLKSSHPIQVPIGKAEEVEEVFDAISYCKGCSVIRMANAVMGHDVFAKGLQQYMARHQYGNTETLDLWTAWQEAAGDKVKVHEVMASWTEQMGFPLLQVKDFTVSGSKAKVSLEQSWFLTSGEEPSEEKTWAIPLFIRTLGKDSRTTVVMTAKTMDVEVQLSGDADNEFVLLNESFMTPLRVSYTAAMRERLVKALKAGHLPAADRAGLVMDAYALAKAGKLGADELLRLLVGYRSETDYIVWDALHQVLVGFQKLLMGGAPPKIYENYMKAVAILVSNASELLAKLGWTPGPSDGHMGGMLRGLLMKVVSRFSPSRAFLEEASRRFAKYVEDPIGQAADLPDEYRVPVFQAVLANTGGQTYHDLQAAFKKLTTNVDQKHVFLSVGYVKESELKAEVLRWAISGEIKLQDFFYAMASVSASSKEGLDMTWQHVQTEFTKIRGMVQDATPIMDAVIQVSTSGYCSEEKASEIEKFFEEHPLPQNKRKLSQVLEEIRISASFLQRTLATDITKDEFWAELTAAMQAAKL